MTAPGNQPGDRADRLLYSVDEAAELLGIGRTLMFRLIGRGDVESVKIGRLRKVSRDALMTYIARLHDEHGCSPTPLRGGSHTR